MSASMTPVLTSTPSPFRAPGRGAATLYDTLITPIGALLLMSDGAALTALHMLDGELSTPDIDDLRRSPVHLREAAAQVRSYFAGELTSFDLPLAPSGTDFQLKVWGALLEIPYGGTTSYGKVAAEIGRPSASRAVGAANGRNPIAVIVPCHRVIGSAGALVGYGGGLDRKRLLLEHELQSGTQSARQ